MSNQMKPKNGNYESGLSRMLDRGKLAWRLFKDKREPFLVKAVVLIVVIGYWIAPDILPFNPADDVIATWLGLVELFIALSPQWLVNHHYKIIQMENRGEVIKPDFKPTSNENSNNDDVIDGDFKQM